MPSWFGSQTSSLNCKSEVSMLMLITCGSLQSVELRFEPMHLEPDAWRPSNLTPSKIGNFLWQLLDRTWSAPKNRIHFLTRRGLHYWTTYLRVHKGRVLHYSQSRHTKANKLRDISPSPSLVPTNNLLFYQSLQTWQHMDSANFNQKFLSREVHHNNAATIGCNFFRGTNQPLLPIRVWRETGWLLLTSQLFFQKK